ncbi:hypothetical protein GH733_004859 [Mirounga leonina]|nr:hypothetical protein GH733_004859 [Mirounga leonina]
MTRYPRTSLEYPWTLDGATERANISIMMPEFQDLQMIGTTSVSEKYRQKEGNLVVPGSREEIAILKPNLDEKAAEPQESLDPIVGNMTCVFVQAIDILVPEKLIADKQCVNCHSLIGLLHLLESIERSGCSPPPWPE